MSDVTAYYDRYWSAEDEPVHQPDPVLAARILDGVGRGTACLDVGCGRANSYAPALGECAGSYVGVDVSPVAVEAAQAAGLDARLITDAGELPFPDASFDHVVCVEVLEHLFAPHDAVAEMRRVLRPGGRLVASVPNAAYWRLRANLLVGLWNPAGDADSIERPWRDPHLRFFTLASFERLLRYAGFTHVEVGGHGGRGLDHATSRPTSFGAGRLYRRAERRLPSLLGFELHAVAVR